jgi:hypoxanthine phosphoribosyltransferase
MQNSQLNPAIERILVSEAELDSAVRRLAEKINYDYKNEPIVLVIILKGSLVFATDLMKHLNMPMTIDFMQASSYGSGTASQGFINIKKDLETDVSGKNVLIIEDIIDSGNTLHKLKELLKERSPKSIRICTILDKPDRRVTDVEVEYSGIVIPDEFVVGYGLDYDEYYRNLPYVGVLKRSIYEK